MDTCMCMAESLPCSPETTTILFVNWLYSNKKKKSLSQDYINRCNKIEIIMKLRKSETKRKIAQS